MDRWFNPIYKSLNAATEIFGKKFHAKVFVLNVIEWTNEQDESWDSRMTSKIEEEGRRKKNA